MFTNRFAMLVVGAFVCATAFAASTEFTYQGQLRESNLPSNGSYDFTFSLFDAASGGNQVGAANSKPAQTVTNGVFTVLLDFGNGAFDGSERYLEISVKKAGGAAFTPLLPRQKVTSAPSAVAFTGALAGDVVGGQLGTAVISVGGLSAAQVASGADAANNATSIVLAGRIVVRDANGNFQSAGPQAPADVATKQYVDTGDAALSAALNNEIARALAAEAALTTSVNAKVNRTGDTMTGNLVLNADPAAALGAATKQYVDTGDTALANSKVSKSGDTMTGLLILSANPAANLGAATKQYVDSADTALQTNINAKVNRTGDTMTGNLVLNADPAAALGAATKQYVDTGDTALANSKVSKSGDTMTGLLILSANPAANLGAATKQYVDAGDAALASSKVSKAGDTMTGDLILNANLAVDTNSLFVDAVNNRVGIGTATPSHALEVAGVVKLRNSFGANQGALTYNAGTGSLFLGPSTGAVAGGATMHIAGSTDPDTLFPGGVRFDTPSVFYALAINSSGNVAIGMGGAAPTQRLDVEGNIRASLRLISTVATGTAPLTVNSTTKVANLNADLLDGLDSAAFLQGVAHDATLSGDGGAIPLGLNLANPNIWTAAQTIKGAGAQFRAETSNGNTTFVIETVPGNTDPNGTFAGAGAGISNTAGGSNSFYGVSSGTSNTNGGANSFFGAFSGEGTTTGNDNSFFGANAGHENTVGNGNAFFGTSSGELNTTGGGNSFFGVSSGHDNFDGFNNSFFGANAGHNNESGTNNTFLGMDAGRQNQTGGNNVYVGSNAGSLNQTGSNNIAIGNNGVNGESNIIRIGTAQTDTFLTGVVHGDGSGLTNVGATVVHDSTLSGEGTAGTPLSLNLANPNTWTAAQAAQGAGAKFQAKATDGSITFAAEAVPGNTGTNNTFVGLSAGQANTTGAFNTFSGNGAGLSNTTGSGNTFSGNSAGPANTTGSNNTFSGNGAGYSNTTGFQNMFSGDSAGYLNTAGFHNAFSGVAAGRNNTSGANNTFSGSNAGFNNTTGSNNTYLGKDSGKNNTSGSGNIDIGHDGVDGESNIIRIGAGQTDTFLTGIIHGNGSAITGVNAATLNGLGSASFLQNVAHDASLTGNGTAGSPLAVAAALAQPFLSIAEAVTVTEGNSGTTDSSFTVTLSAPSASTVTVEYSTVAGTATPGDYNSASGMLTFNPTDPLSQTITANVNGDVLDEDTETFFVKLSNPVNAKINVETAVATITDDEGTPSLSINGVTMTEGNSGFSAAVFTVTLSNPSQKLVTVDFTTSDGAALVGKDYVASADKLIFAPGSTTQTITILVIGDLFFEPDESFFVGLTNEKNATINVGLGSCTITNEDASPQIDISGSVVIEPTGAGTPAIFTVKLSNPSYQLVSVNFQTQDGTATLAANDYANTNGTLTFDPGETARTISVVVNPDNFNEADEVFSVLLSGENNATINTGTAAATIHNTGGPVDAATLGGLAPSAFLQNVAHDATLIGNGTTVSPLSVAAEYMYAHAIPGVVVPPNTKFTFPSGAVSSPGITMVANSQFSVATAANYRIDFSITTQSSTFLQLFKNGAPVGNSGTLCVPTGAPIVVTGRAIVAIAPGDVIELRNASGVNISTVTNGASVSASILIEKLK